jgi:hypothetical protein
MRLGQLAKDDVAEFVFAEQALAPIDGIAEGDEVGHATILATNTLDVDIEVDTMGKLKGCGEVFAEWLLQIGHAKY